MVVRFTGRLLTRLLVPYTLLIALAFSVAGWFFLHTAVSTLDESLSKRLLGHAKVVAGSIRPDYLKRLRPGDENTRLYRILMRKLSAHATAAEVDDLFIIDRNGLVLLDVDEETPIGQEYLFLKLDATELSRVWQGEPTASTLYADDEGALYKSGYAPIVDETGRVFAAVGVEAGAGFLGAVATMRKDIILLVVMAVILTALISMALSRSIAGPVNRLVSAFGQVRGKAVPTFGEEAIDEEQRYPTVPVATHDEVGLLTHSFNEMTRHLREKDEELTRLYQVERERAERIQGLSFLVFEGIPSGVIGINLSSRVLLCNPAAAAILSIDGYPFPETGIPPALDDVLSPDSPVYRCLMGSLNEKREYLREDVNWTTPDGEDGVLGITGFPLSDTEGNPVGAIAIFSDLTEIAQLQNQVQIRARLAALGELSAGIAHEIRNPLGAIRGFMELLGRQVNDEKGQKIVENVLKEVTGLNHLVTDFLTFARAPSLAPEMVRPAELINEALAIALPGSDTKVEVNLEVEDNLPDLEVDPVQVKQALVNVLQNGATAMGDKGGTLSVQVSRERDGITFRIGDTGPGIPAEIGDKIFNPFFTTRADGTGLGLAIVGKVVEGHGGRIRLENSTEGGARFALWFPLELRDIPAQTENTEVGKTI